MSTTPFHALRLSKKVRYVAQAIPAFAMYHFLQCLPLQTSSYLMGSLAKKIGRFFKVSHVAESNLKRALPHLHEAERRVIIKGVWENLGRLVGEMPRLYTLPIIDSGERPKTPHIFVENAHLLKDFIAAQKNVVFISAHMGNWDVNAYVAKHYKLVYTGMFREANNPLMNYIIQRNRRLSGGEFAPKGALGTRQLINALKKKHHLFFMMDVKMSDGMAVPFFGHPAMTATGAIELAARFNVPLLFGQPIREENGCFRFVIHPPMTMPAIKMDDAQRFAVLKNINDLLESWVRENPEQWLWLHRRWKE